jgi:tetratricopeptide (TPR) repeat protein
MKPYRSRLAAILLMWAAVGFAQSPARREQEIQGHVLRAQQALAANDPATADKEYHAVLAIDPNHLVARANLGVVLYSQGKWREAAEQLGEAVKIQADPKVQALLGMCEKRLGRPAEARKMLEQALRSLKPGRLYTQTGLELLELFYQTGELEQATGLVAKLKASDVANPDVLYAAYRLYADLANDAEEALALAAPDSGRMHLCVAQHLINLGDAQGAVEQYRKALALDPHLRGVHAELGEAVLLGSASEAALAEAEKEFRAALVENPADANAEYRLGMVFLRRGELKIAAEHFSHALKLDPGHAYAHAGLGEVYMRLDERQKALEHLLAATRLNPMNARAHYRLASLYRSMGREEDSRAELSKFKTLQESRNRLQNSYKEMHQALRDLDQAAPAETPME